MSKDNIKGSSPFLFHLQEKSSTSFLILRFLILSVCLTVIFLPCPYVCLSICLSTLSACRPTLLLICLSIFLFVCFSIHLPILPICLFFYLYDLSLSIYPAHMNVLSFYPACLSPFLPCQSVCLLTLPICLFVCLSSYPIRHTNRKTDRQTGRIFRKIGTIFEVLLYIQESKGQLSSDGNNDVQDSLGHCSPDGDTYLEGSLGDRYIENRIDHRSQKEIMI